jgi:predicted TIM-barrel fold metal-dependent hydrolase
MSHQSELPDDWMISVDDHVVEPPHVWSDRLRAADRDRGPHVERIDGVDHWVYEDVAVAIRSTLVQAGTPRDQVRPGPINYDHMRPAMFDPVARIQDLNLDGVAASLCFPYFPRYCGQTFAEARDRSLAHACVRAYNDWMIDEWCGTVPGRFIPLVIIPLWDPRAAAGEIERCRAKGARAVAFSENPAKLGLPSLHDVGGYWDPVLEAANDTKMPICIHFGSSSMVPRTSDDAPLFVEATLTPLSLAYALADWLFCRKLPRYPDLKVCLSEGGIGWIPYLLERAEYVLDTVQWAIRFGDGTYEPGETDPGMPPTEIFRRHVFGCFIDDTFGARNLEAIGIDNVMMETDYPHGDGTFPGSIANAHRLLDGYDMETRYKVMQGNARRVFDFTPTPTRPPAQPA